MNNLNFLNTGNNIKEQRENLLNLNHDLLFGVYSLKEHNHLKQKIKLELCLSILTCYPNQLQNLKGLGENPEITILDLHSLRKGEIKVLHGKNVNIHMPVLLSNGVIDYVTGSTGKKHMITTLRDSGVIDSLERTTTAGRNIGSNLDVETLREHIEECPFLGRNRSGEYVLATISKKPEDLEILIQAIHHFTTQKHNLERNNPLDIAFIKAFERNFPGIKYEELADILKDIVKNNRFMQYYLKDGKIDGIDGDTTNIEIFEENKIQSTGNFFTFFDQANNTIEYRKIQEISGFEDGFIPISKRPGRLFLESKNQYPRIPRIEQAYQSSNLVPTIDTLSKKVALNVFDIIIGKQQPFKYFDIPDYEAEKGEYITDTEKKEKFLQSFTSHYTGSQIELKRKKEKSKIFDIFGNKTLTHLPGEILLALLDYIQNEKLYDSLDCRGFALFLHGFSTAGNSKDITYEAGGEIQIGDIVGFGNIHTYHDERKEFIPNHYGIAIGKGKYLSKLGSGYNKLTVMSEKELLRVYHSNFVGKFSGVKK